jgi:uncharacterized PurR-regulated membrane protein YhhQ (DUF165 family)
MTTKILAAAGFIATILAANLVTTGYGMVPVGFGLTAIAGTYFAGLAFILRDLLHDKAGRRAVVVAIVAGAALSYLLCAPFVPWFADGSVPWWRIATASAIAFLLSEGADFAVYSPLRKRGYIRAAVASNLVGSIVDTVLFLTIAGFPLRQAFAGQLVGKMAVTGVVIAGVAVLRYTRRPVTA